MISYFEEKLYTLESWVGYQKRYGYDPDEVKVVYLNGLKDDTLLLANQISVYFGDDPFYRDYLIKDIRDIHDVWSNKTFRLSHLMSRRKGKK
jgi:hypothetical protein